MPTVVSLLQNIRADQHQYEKRAIDDGINVVGK
jgi:hypothetical protein